MDSEADLETLYALQRCSTPERWAAFMALAGYLVKHPEQRLGQAIVNVLAPRAEGDLGQPDLFYVTDDAAARAFTVQRAPHLCAAVSQRGRGAREQGEHSAHAGRVPHEAAGRWLHEREPCVWTAVLRSVQRHRVTA